MECPPLSAASIAITLDQSMLGLFASPNLYKPRSSAIFTLHIAAEMHSYAIATVRCMCWLCAAVLLFSTCLKIRHLGACKELRAIGALSGLAVSLGLLAASPRALAETPCYRAPTQHCRPTHSNKSLRNEG